MKVKSGERISTLFFDELATYSVYIGYPIVEEAGGGDRARSTEARGGEGFCLFTRDCAP